MAYFDKDSVYGYVNGRWQHLRGTEENDVFYLEGRSGVAYGMGGFDFMVGGHGRDRFFLGYGEDGDGDTSGGHISGMEGNDRLFGDDGDNRIHGGDGDGDLIIGNGGDDWLDGGAGHSDIVSYRYATGRVIVDLKHGTVSGADGNDTIRNFEQIEGSEHNDVILGNDRGNVIKGLGGGDVIAGGRGRDSIYGGDGDDLIFGGEMLDFQGTQGLINVERGGAWPASTIQAGLGNDTIFGTAGDDVIDTGPERQPYTGLDRDMVYLTYGSDEVEAFHGRATVSYEYYNPTNPFQFRGETSGIIQTVPSDGQIFQLRVEKHTWVGAWDWNNGEPDVDTLLQVETVIGSKFSDILEGSLGDDSRYGGFGDDFIFASLGDDWLDGGFHHDTLSFEKFETGVRLVENVAISHHDATSNDGATSSYARIENFEEILGTAHEDDFHLVDPGHVLRGGDGGDLFGLSGGNVVWGEAGADRFELLGVFTGVPDEIADYDFAEGDVIDTRGRGVRLEQRSSDVALVDDAGTTRALILDHLVSDDIAFI